MSERTDYQKQVRGELRQIEAILELCERRLKSERKPRTAAERELLRQLYERERDLEFQLEELTVAKEERWGDLRADLETTRARLLDGLDESVPRLILVQA